MAHKGHLVCEHNSKAACDKARRIAIGQCSTMVAEDKPCPHWGIDKVNDRPYCGLHVRAIFLAADAARRQDEYRKLLTARIDRSLLWHRLHPSVWDRMPEGWNP